MQGETYGGSQRFWKREDSTNGLCLRRVFYLQTSLFITFHLIKISILYSTSFNVISSQFAYVICLPSPLRFDSQLRHSSNSHRVTACRELLGEYFNITRFSDNSVVCLTTIRRLHRACLGYWKLSKKLFLHWYTLVYIER